MFAEQVQLLRYVLARLRRDGLAVTPYLGEVGCLELQGEVHQRVGDVGSCFVGDGIVG